MASEITPDTGPVNAPAVETVEAAPAPAAIVEQAAPIVEQAAPIVEAAPAALAAPVKAKVGRPRKVQPTEVAVAKEATTPKKAIALKKKAIVKKITKPASKPVVTKISPSAPKVVPAVKAAPAASSPVRKVKLVSLAKPAPLFPKLIAAEKVQTMFSDINVRAKAAFEKTTKAGEEITEFTKGNMEAFAVSAKTAAKGAETLGQELADYGKKNFEAASATMKSLAAVKTPTEMFQIQSDYAKTAFDGAVAEASKLSEAWLKLAGDVFQPLSTRYALAAEKIKAATL